MTFRSCVRLATGLALALVLLAGCASQPTQHSSDRFESGKSAYLSGDFSSAFDLLLPEAQNGNPDAQYTIGYMYYLGQGVEQNEQEALEWIQLSANAGNNRAIQALGELAGMGSHRQQATPEETPDSEQ